jgi:hypothetical protein
MKKELLQKISGLCCFAVNDKECIKLQTYLILEDYTSARIYLDKIIEDIEWRLSFDEDDNDLKYQLKHSNELMNLVIELIIVNEREKRNEQVRTITQ